MIITIFHLQLISERNDILMVIHSLIFTMFTYNHFWTKNKKFFYSFIFKGLYAVNHNGMFEELLEENNNKIKNEI